MRHPEPRKQVNRVHAKFHNAARDLEEDAVTFPVPGSALATQLQELDGEIIEANMTFGGIINPVLAHSAAANAVLQGREPRGAIITTLSPFASSRGASCGCARGRAAWT